MSLTRKIMRFGSGISILLRMLQRFKDSQNAPVKLMFFTTLADLFGLLYVLMDHPMYFVKVGFLKSWSPEKAARWDKYTDLMWFLEVMIQIPLHMVSI